MQARNPKFERTPIFALFAPTPKLAQEIALETRRLTSPPIYVSPTVMASVAMNATRAALAAAATDQAVKLATSATDTNPGNLVPWTPAKDALQSITNLLKETTTGSTNIQHQIYSQLQSYATQSDFNNYLVYILANGCTIPELSQQQIEGVRQAAGLLLNSNIRLLYTTLPIRTREYMHAQLLSAIGDTSNIVRHVAATCISTIVVTTQDIAAFSGLITTLVQCLDLNRPSFLNGALKVLSHLAEDVPNLLDQDRTRPLDALLPKIIQLCYHPVDSVRASSLQILNHLILVMPRTLFENVDAFCQTLFSRAEDSSAQVRKRVCTAICLLLEVAPKALMPYMKNIIQYMLLSSEHHDELIAREASEFWTLMTNLDGAADMLRPFLPQIVPLFLRNMVYSSQDIAFHEAVNAPDEMLPDKEEDIRPRFHQPTFKDLGFSKQENGGEPSGHTNGKPGSGVGVAQDSATNGKHSTDGSYDSEDEDFEDWEDFKGESEWNLRKCSAASLDAFAVLFKDELLDILLPELQKKLTNAERWEQRECGVLALGAIAEGCYAGMLRHMRSIFPFLVHAVTDQQIMVRSISCWTLSRYSRWVVVERDDALIQQLLKVLLDRMLDRNKLVQKAACSALAIFVEESGTLITSYLTPVLRSLSLAFERYQQSNLIVLYDVVCTMADAVGNELANPDHLNVLMPLLIAQWNSVTDMEPVMLSLLECLSHVFRALGIHSQQFAANLFSRCANMMDSIYTKESRGEREDNHVEFLTCCLDLMCALAEALGPNVEQFVSTSTNGSKSVLPILFVCMKDTRQEVRQSAFALLGEFARARIPSLIPALPEYVRGTVEALNPEYMSVSNNATWALGELAIMAGFLPPQVPVNRENIKRTLLEGALDPLIRVVNIPQLNKSLLENSALTLGRLGLVLADVVAPKLSTFAESVFASLRDIRDDVEKEQAFRGMNAMVKLNPTAIFDCFVHYVDAIASWFHCKPDLEMEFASILAGYKSSLGDQWFSLFNSFPPTLQSLLKERFGL